MKWAQPRVYAALTVALGMGATTMAADGPQAREFAACRAWYERTFGAGARAAPEACLEIVKEDVPEPITRGKSWRGTPYQIAGKTYTHGLAFNANKLLRIHLPGPGERFTADVGLENNDDTQRGAAQGKGSVTFAVLLSGREVLTTPVMRLKDEPIAVAQTLGGATEFELRVGDGGDGRDYDQAVWAEATIALKDGTRLRLQDLPLRAGTQNPFGVAFLCDGKSSATLLPGWKREVVDIPADSRAASGSERSATPTHRRVTYNDPSTGIVVRIEAELFADFPAVEWVAYLKNTGNVDTPIIEALQSLDATFETTTERPILHWANGATADFDDFAPRETPLGGKDQLRLVPGGEGKSSSQVLPYFNLTRGASGVVLAIGWTGEWAAEFAGGPGGAVQVRCGQERTRLRLHPGEEIRTPRIALLFYDGADRWRSQNLWRRFVLAHHRPRVNGAPLVAPVTCGNWGGTAAEVHLDNIVQMNAHDFPCEYYWIDAEWFGSGVWWRAVGDWRVKQDLYPQGFRPISAALHKSKRKFLLWFEPERVFQDTVWWKEHPEWLLGAGGDIKLLNLGNPDARRFVTDYISKCIDEYGLDCYRQDFNTGMLAVCRKADPPEREGITEIRYVEGLYAFWDELLARHPGLLIDNCASGGKRLDLEMLGRGTPLWRTDGPRDALAHQCHTWGLLPWIPLSAASEDRVGDDYEFRSSMCSALALNWWVHGDVPATKIAADFPWDWAKKTVEQYLSFRRFYYGDYYPLTSYSQARDVWMVYQLDLPESGEGLIVALRRPESPYETARFKLRGVEDGNNYVFKNLDSGNEQQFRGAVLLKDGVELTLPAAPGSALLQYRRTD